MNTAKIKDLDSNYCAAILSILKGYSVSHSLFLMGIWIHKTDEDKNKKLIKRRKGSNAYEVPPREVLEKMHLIDEMSLAQISRHYEVCKPLVSKWFKDLGIEIVLRPNKRVRRCDDI